MSERAIDPVAKTKLFKPYLQRLVANPPTNAPSPAQMCAIAAALNVSERRVKARSRAVAGIRSNRVGRLQR